MPLDRLLGVVRPPQPGSPPTGALPGRPESAPARVRRRSRATASVADRTRRTGKHPIQRSCGRSTRPGTTAIFRKPPTTRARGHPSGASGPRRERRRSRAATASSEPGGGHARPLQPEYAEGTGSTGVRSVSTTGGRARTPADAGTDPLGDPYLRTRFALPCRPATFLRRQRLTVHLNQALRTPLTLVNGSAGAGKTLPDGRLGRGAAAAGRLADRRGRRSPARCLLGLRLRVPACVRDQRGRHRRGVRGLERCGMEAAGFARRRTERPRPSRGPRARRVRPDHCP
ncbi:hypothetical protein STENM36S_04954 [Streptomyces tendae]